MPRRSSLQRFEAAIWSTRRGLHALASATMAYQNERAPSQHVVGELVHHSQTKHTHLEESLYWDFSVYQPLTTTGHLLHSTSSGLDVFMAVLISGAHASHMSQGWDYLTQRTPPSPVGEGGARCGEALAEPRNEN